MLRIGGALTLITVLGILTPAQGQTPSPGQIGFALYAPGEEETPPEVGEVFDVHVVLTPTHMGLIEIEFEIREYVPNGIVLELGQTLHPGFEDLDPDPNVFRLRSIDGCWSGRAPVALVSIAYLPLEENLVEQFRWTIARPSFMGGTAVSPSYRTCDGVKLPLVRHPVGCEYEPPGSLTSGPCLVGAYVDVLGVRGGLASGLQGEIASYHLRVVTGSLLRKKQCDLWPGDQVRSIDFTVNWDEEIATWEHVFFGSGTDDWITEIALEPGRAHVRMDAGISGNEVPFGSVLIIPQFRLVAERGWSPVVMRVLSGTTDRGEPCIGDTGIGQIYAGVRKLSPWAPGEAGIPEALRTHHLLASEGLLRFEDYAWADIDLDLGLTTWDVQSYLRAAMGRPIRSRAPSFGAETFSKVGSFELHIPVSASDGLLMMFELAPNTPYLRQVRSNQGVVDWWRHPYYERLQIALSDLEARPHFITLQFDDPIEGILPILHSLRGFDSDGNAVEVSTSYHVTSTPVAFERSRLLPPVPNPSNPGTRFRVVLQSPAVVELDIYDVRGRRLRQIGPVRMMDGEGSIPWDGNDELGSSVGSGVYFARLVVDGTPLDQTKLMIVR